jgi:hypothetical protein
VEMGETAVSPPPTTELSAPENSAEPAAAVTNGICGAAMLMPLFIVTGWIGLKRRNKKGES